MGPGMPIQIHAFDDQHIPGLQKIAASMHETDNSCKIIAQLVCFGEDVGPSAISWPDEAPVRALSIDEIETTVKRSAEAIRRVKDSGFDGAAINGHYVYLISSFLSPHTNKRNDKYGGSVEKRVRIVREIVEAARRKVGRDFPILIKVNCDDSFSPDKPIEDGTNMSNFPRLAAEIEKAGVDAIELSGNNLLRKKIDSVDKESYFENYTKAIDVKIPVILTGGNRSIDHLEEIIKKGKVSFFGLARPLIREPDLANRWLAGRGSASAKCISCNGCLSADGPLRCIQEKA
jgi:2,4-dienoyl-CoA reductase-like NADH-dependent reductase (Old Yellow Enzyme family)